MCLHIYWDTWSHKKALAFSYLDTHMHIYPLVHPHTHTYTQAGPYTCSQQASNCTHTWSDHLSTSMHMHIPACSSSIHNPTRIPAYIACPPVHTYLLTLCLHTPPPTHWYTHVLGCSRSHLLPAHTLIHHLNCMHSCISLPVSAHKIKYLPPCTNT